MLDDRQMLNYIRETAEMGQIGIESVLKHAKSENFRAALEQQLTEYDKITSQADNLIESTGGQRNELGAVPKVSVRMTAFFQTLNDDSESKIAEMMIMGNTAGIAKIIKHINDYNREGEISQLSNQLLRTEQANIEQMKKFL